MNYSFVLILLDYKTRYVNQVKVLKISRRQHIKAILLIFASVFIVVFLRWKLHIISDFLSGL